MTSLKLISATDVQYSESLLKSVNAQRIAGLFCDVTVIVQGREFRAHKNILSASSSYFHGLFLVAGEVIELNFISANVFEAILNYMYSSKIIRVRSDMLEELIRSGQTLGLNFIANLDVPLSQVKGLPHLSKCKIKDNNSVLLTQQSSSGGMPVISEAFSLSKEKFTQQNGQQDTLHVLSDDEDDDDVLFVSEQEPQKTGIFSSAQETPKDVFHVDPVPAMKKVVVNEQERRDLVMNKNDMVENGEDPSIEKNVGGAKTALYSTPPKQPKSVAIDLPVQQKLVDTSSVNSSEAALSSSCCSFEDQGCSLTDTRTPINNSSKDLHQDSLVKECMSIVQRNKVSTVMESQDKPRHLKGKLSDVRTVGETVVAEEGAESNSSAPSVQVRNSFRENSIGTVKNRRRASCMKMKRTYKSLVCSSSFQSKEDHTSRARYKRTAKSMTDCYYEEVVDQKVKYVCVVCKRQYHCLSSVKRHFNMHSWEKKYPCRYCSEVFALAESRTRHEIQHTGERRYQCLLCRRLFMSYVQLTCHWQQAHNWARKKEFKAHGNLYRLLPCKSLGIRSYCSVSRNSKAASGRKGGPVHHLDLERESLADMEGTTSAQDRAVSFDTIFEPGAQTVAYLNLLEGSPEFEFIIPETY